jgi:hypothetical protein
MIKEPKHEGKGDINYPASSPKYPPGCGPATTAQANLWIKIQVAKISADNNLLTAKQSDPAKIS